MAETFDIVFKGGTVVNQDGEGRADIGVRDGKIRAIGDIGEGLAGETIDARGLHILPGVIDSQVHFREPGMEHKEDLETGSRSAVLGGVTAVFEMPNTKPPTSNAEALAAKVAAATDRMHCDFAFFVGAFPIRARLREASLGQELGQFADRPQAPVVAEGLAELLKLLLVQLLLQRPELLLVPLRIAGIHRVHIVQLLADPSHLVRRGESSRLRSLKLV